jgi:ribosomal subunit interface protein
MDIKTFKFTNIKVSPSLQDYVWEKMMKLQKFLARVGLPQNLRIEVGKSTKHHKEGRFFRAEATLELPGALLRAEAEAYDLRAAADYVHDELVRQIKDLKGKLGAKQKRGARIAKKKAHFSHLAYDPSETDLSLRHRQE